MRKTALITGAGRGIGRATAVLAAQEGYDLCVNFVSDRKAAEETAALCEAQGARVLLFQADVADEVVVADMFEAFDREIGRIDLLVNNAGIIGQASRVEDLEPATLRRTFEANLFGTMFCAQQAVRRMSRRNGGSGGAIVNVSSIAAVIGSANEYVHYAASKGAVESFTIGLSKEVGPEGIRVNALRAGTAETEIHERTGNPDRPAMVAANAPLRRVATPQDIAEGIMWLASDRAAYVTGACLPVSGGL
ncbi:SDR family oxidoreductase [Qingshengfaniella alkalisoli]|uniref:SDR family oxidoreductase n=1 Tax=Qingshengfaniella alkalisoli TaxID=2599296 RepID=A0A5B8J296_9RHOB|nr:SDR family oxidoreductase [Qingshengfaniella alkalisoli]QDY68360.1 SDR family oxidoreductase [Qingshengfaniella alkalisoli]